MRRLRAVMKGLMTWDRTGRFVTTAFQRILRRTPSREEHAHWVKVTVAVGPAEVLDLLFASGEYAHRSRVDDLSEFHAGHYYSPVIDPEALRASGFTVDRSPDTAALPGIALDAEAMLAFWDRNLAGMQASGVVAHETPPLRYYAVNDVYAWGDAYVLNAMIAELAPRRILEIGSGFSSACMLDAVDRLGLATSFTFVEPYAERLQARLSDQDRARCTIIETPVQQVGAELYEVLEPGDILFIDSTHVSKAGSDVNFELFEMLPALRPGVIVHFHDTFFPFEYPEAWIFEARRSWNELYILRAFLTDNPAWEIVFFNDYFARRHPQAAAALPGFQANPGGGLWLRKRG
ncbi:class I SAM-dependent methyltransferase [Phenylobacterium sp.]|uniref:class I SAM-dependent methyltransferase n=1 Tax=Phenylobacterium sp. TaxID=1871053 RepID=UPI0039839998